MYLLFIEMDNDKKAHMVLLLHTGIFNLNNKRIESENI